MQLVYANLANLSSIGKRRIINLNLNKIRLLSGMKLRLYPLKLYLRSLPVALLSGSALVLNIFSWLWLWIQIPRGVDQLFLHYSILFGVDFIGTRTQIFYVPLLGLVIWIVNTFAGWILYRKDNFMSHVLNFVNLLCQIFVVIATFLLVFLNV